MPRQIKPDQKADALEILAVNGGDIAQAHEQTGIAERTLYRWRSELWQTWRRQAPPPPSPKPLPEFDDDLDALTFLRQKIMTELLNIANNFPEGVAYATSAQRTAQLSQLLNRMMELDEHLKPYKPAEEYRIVFSWDAGLYLRTERGYHGPFTPGELPKNWKQRYGPSTRLEFYWGAHTFTLLPDEGDMLKALFDTRDFNDEPCELADPSDDGLERRYGRRYG